MHQQRTLTRMRRDKDHAVHGRHVERGEIRRPSTRRPRDALFAAQARLLNVEAVQSAAARIAEQHDVAESRGAQELDAGGHVVEREFVLEADIIADRTRRL